MFHYHSAAQTEPRTTGPSLGKKTWGRKLRSQTVQFLPPLTRSFGRLESRRASSEKGLDELHIKSRQRGKSSLTPNRELVSRNKPRSRTEAARGHV